MALALRGSNLRADVQNRRELGGMRTPDPEWSHRTTCVLTPFEDRPHFTLDDRLPIHQICRELKPFRTSGANRPRPETLGGSK